MANSRKHGAMEISQHDGNAATAQPYRAPSSDTGYVVGVDIGGTNLRLALANLSGAIVAKWSSSTAGVRGADAVVGLICDGIKNVLQQTSVPRDSLKGIAVGVPGVTDVEEGRVIATSYLLGWRDVPLAAMLEAALNIPSAVDNDVNLAAVGESWAGAAKGAPDFAFVAIGTGIGAGIVLNHSLFHGAGWAAGEIGYMLVPGTPNAPRKRDEPGALESMIGGEGIRAEWQKLWSADKTTLPREMIASEIFDAALAGDPLAQTILQQSARMLSHAIYNMSLVLNCPLFVLGGGVGLHPALCAATRGMLQQWAVRGRPDLIASELGPDAQLMGALRLAIDTAELNSPVSAAK
ncbi:MAG TPA: ROK family protein [Acidobacteriaceae bacterium]|nr:ROK family protein [Acidobacteriaceae bacterium]